MSTHNMRTLKKQVAPYEKSSAKDSTLQLLNTFIPFFFLWFLAYKSLTISYLLTLFLAVIAAGFLVRIFIIFHDCGHYSFFRKRWVNRAFGTFAGVLTLFPFDKWSHEHSVHHATSSNLDKRGTGDLWLLTVDEYHSASFWKRIGYRLYRNPFMLFVLGPFYQFLIKNRFNRKGARRGERMNTYLTNFLIVVFSGILIWGLGWENFLLIQGPIFFLSGSAGIWLFYVQHTFEDSYFEEDESWEYVKAAVEGSSFYKLPKLLQWLTGNIGYHHVHHLSPRVPNYRLEAVHNNTAELQNVPTVTLRTSLLSLRFHLWDEKNKNFIGFKDLKGVAKKNSVMKVKPEL